MPTERFAMRHVRDVIRLMSAGMPTREIARRVGTAPSTVRVTIRRFEAAGLTWPLPDDVTDTVLEARLFAGAGAGPGPRQGHRRQAEPDWAAVHRELKRKHVTLSILWEEYIAGEPGGYRFEELVEWIRSYKKDLERFSIGPSVSEKKYSPPTLVTVINDKASKDIVANVRSECEIDGRRPAKLMTNTLALVSDLAGAGFEIMPDQAREQRLSELE